MFFVYLHKRKDNNQVFYIGKGKLKNGITEKQKYKRAFVKSDRTFHWKNIVNKYGYLVEIIGLFNTEKEALDYEECMISLFGVDRKGGLLCNIYESSSQEHLSLTRKKSEPDFSKVEIPVHKYSLEGIYIESFKSLTEAAASVNCTVTCMSTAIGNIKGRSITTLKGYRWSKTKEEKLCPFYLKEYKNLVVQYDLKGCEVGRFKNPKECSKQLGISYSALRNNLNKLSFSCNNFIFRYEKEPPPESVTDSLWVYDLEGKLINSFKTFSEAEVCLGIPKNIISTWLRRYGGRVYKNMYVFSLCIDCHKLKTKDYRNNV